MTKPSRPSKKPIALTQAQAYAVAAAAQVDPRTVKRVAAGLPTRQMVTDRVMSALKSLGILVALLVVGCGIPKPGASPEEAANVASTVSLVQMLAAGMATSAGLPLASGRARFYLPSTLTPVSVYADSAAATPISPPLILTAGGTGIAYTKVPTRMVVKDSTDTTTVFDGLVNIDRAEQAYIQSTSINGGTETTLQAWLDAYSTSFGGSAGLWKIKTSASAVERNLIDLLFDNARTSVKSFGAAGDGIADDTAEIQAAIDYVVSIGGGDVFFPPGTYLTSSPLTLGATAPTVSFVGASYFASVIKNTNTATNTFTIATGNPTNFKNIGISHSSTSTGIAVSSTGGSTLSIDNCKFLNHAKLVASPASVLMLNSILTTAPASVLGALALTGNATSTIIGSTLTSVAGSGVTTLAGSLNLVLIGCVVSGATAAIDLGSTSSLFAYGVVSGNGAGYRAAATVGAVFAYGSSLGTVIDGRTGAPVNYVFAGANNMTPLPLQADVIRVEQQTGAVVTTINNIAAIGFKTFTLICSNTSGGGSTFTFGANYVLSAAVTPAAGNRVSLLLAYDSISGKTYEVGRAATAN